MAGYKGKQGAKPKPTALKKLGNTYRADRANHDEPEGAALSSVPKCPTHIKGEARKAWRTMGQKLIGMRVLTEADLHALEAYCTIYARWKEAQEKLDEYGVVMKSKDGWFEQSPYLKVVDNCLKQMRAFMTEFGITPSSRARVNAVRQEEKDIDPFDAMIKVNQRN